MGVSFQRLKILMPTILAIILILSVEWVNKLGILTEQVDAMIFLKFNARFVNVPIFNQITLKTTSDVKFVN